MSEWSGRDFEFVIIGGGAVGCGVAYSLAAAGHRDVLLLERAGDLGEATTSQGAGLCGQIRDSAERTRLAMRAVQIFRELQAHAAVKPDWNEVGSLRLALSDAAVAQFHHLQSVAAACGIQSALIAREEAEQLWPALNFERVQAVLWCPADGFLRPKSLVASYQSECQAMGLRFAAGTEVHRIQSEAGRAAAVITSGGTVRCRYVINAAGANAYHVARLAGLELPIIPVRHEYFVSAEITGLEPRFPCFRIPDLGLYGRVEERGLLLGGWEPAALHADPRDYCAAQSPPDIEPDWKVLNAFEKEMTQLFSGSVGIEKTRVGKGWPTFTPDGRFIIGESSRLPGFVMAGGCNAHGISGSGGIGKLLVESLFDENPSDYVRSLSPDRFTETPWNWNDAARQARQVYETYYCV
ncbi:MAG TPA: FAD-binding oxidoreductase [Verrucomicrobiales bacterium]|nr:FAD-binding oxidoreductase [Verrucomicrobiales bacterium]